jgi:superfamily II DNA or RNA helicase
MTVVMPTGTGKTETMLAVFAVDPKRTSTPSL